MRKTITGILLAALAFTGCTGNYLDYNTDPNNATEEQMQYEYYFSQGAIRSLQGYIVPTEEHYFQFCELLLGGNLGGYFSEQKTFPGTFATFDSSDGWNGAIFDRIPEIYGAYNLLLSSGAVDDVVMAVADISRVAGTARIADAYGPLPFSKVGADAKLTAPYDTVEELYDQFLSILTSAIEKLTVYKGTKFKSTSDFCFGGDVNSWIKFANSLKLRYAMRIVYADPAKAQKAAEEVAADPIGTIDSNGDNPTFNHPSRNQYYFCVQQWGDHRASADIISYMNGFSDPRRSAYFTTSSYSGGGYVGWRRGVPPAMAPLGNKASNMDVADNTPMYWFCAAEVAFLKAEGALRGWNMGGTARDFYEQGVRLSFDQWGVSGADAYLADSQSSPESYVDPSGSGFDASFDTSVTPAWDASADFEGCLERIITQKWIANFRIEGMEAWSDFRRTGYPKLLPSAANNSGGIIPEGGYARRLIYPISETNSNNANYIDAVNKDLGGSDTMASRLWWDCNPNTK